MCIYTVVVLEYYVFTRVFVFQYMVLYVCSLVYLQLLFDTFTAYLSYAVIC